MRGEYPTRYATKMDRAELPPRARRILGLIRCCKACRGTTSACAENTYCFRPFELGSWNYLRVRGEYRNVSAAGEVNAELPPRARRILVKPVVLLPETGTTSACAENTCVSWLVDPEVWNYLRVRGEYASRTVCVPA